MNRVFREDPLRNWHTVRRHDGQYNSIVMVRSEL
jgi:hypothetical protein